MLTPGAARAATVVEAQTIWRYDASEYTIDQGEELTFRNADSASPGPHDVTADTTGPDGRPLFASETIPAGQETPVVGAQQLTTGSYSFFCTVHPFMQATLTVTANGTPLPPGGSPPPSSPPPQSGDTRAPGLTASLARISLGRFLRTRRIRALVTSNETAALTMRLTARVGSRVRTLATAAVPRAGAGRTTVILRSSRSRLRPFRNARRLRLALAVEGRDEAGNTGTAQARRTLRR